MQASIFSRFLRIFLLGGWAWIVWLSGLSFRTLADDFPATYDSPTEAHLTPMGGEQAAATMKLPSGFRANCFACEPMVQNPIAMAWDDRGRLWIAENFTYADRQQRFDLSLRDRVIILQDTNGDGRADLRRVFTDHVQMLTGVEIARNGVWLMSPPQLLFVPDEDADDNPDGPPQVVLDGFEVAKDNYHNFANGLRWGPDGWLYGRSGHSCPGLIGPPGSSPENRIPIKGGLWRWHPTMQRFEVLCHGTVNPWGHDWDQNAQLFFINPVIGHLWHCIPGGHFIESFGSSPNPLVYERMGMIADHYHYDTSGQWMDSRDGKANDLGGGHAHVGMLIYQSDRWPVDYQHKLFTLNLHGRRANIERLERFESSYLARHEPDFLVSADSFFRGMDLNVGPDGQVYIIDWSDTGECHEHTGVHRSSGRVFRVAYEGEKPLGESWPPVASGSGLTRFDRLPGEVYQLLARYRRQSVKPDELRKLLKHPDEHIRVWAIRLLTDAWPLDTMHGPLPAFVYPDDPLTRSEFIGMARGDESGLVHLTLASTLQRLPAQNRVELAEHLIQHSRYSQDRFLPNLVWYGLIPLAQSNPVALIELFAKCNWDSLRRWISRFAASQIDQSPELLDRLLATATDLPIEHQQGLLDGMLAGLRGRLTARQPDHWQIFANGPLKLTNRVELRELAVLFGEGHALAEIRQIVMDERVDLSVRQQALQTLIDARPPELQQICQSLVDTRPINAVAIKGLSLIDDPQLGRELAAKYRRFLPEDRPGVLQILLSRRSFAAGLLSELSAKSSAIPMSDFTAAHARQIRNLQDPHLDALLGDVWGQVRDSPTEKRAEIERWTKELAKASESIKSVPTKALSAGRLLFQERCSNCHRLFGEGQLIGPDLTGSQRFHIEYLLENIIDPSAVVSKDYRQTVVQMIDGRVLSGLVVSQDSQWLVLQTATEQLRLSMTEVEQAEVTQLSAMPDGLLHDLNRDQVKNLVSYLMSPTQVPLP